jgi:uncharacterized protein (TIGR02001 family)
MARRREAGIIRSFILGAAFVAGAATCAQADDRKIELSATANFVTDYLFRGVTNTSDNPAVQPEFDVTYGMFYVGMWGSNTDFGDGIEIDYYGGIRPTWNNLTFDIAGLEYTYPGSNGIDYFELKTGASWASMGWTLGVTNYWSPDWGNAAGSSDAIEGKVGYDFSGKILNFFSPGVSGGVGFQSFDHTYTDYTYWNAGLTLGFLDHWSADVRYWDTNLGSGDCVALSGVSHGCDARVVGTLSASF